MTPTPLIEDRVRRLLDDLEAVRENLLGLSDAVWQNIEHNDPEALEEGVAFKRVYNTKLATFQGLAEELSELVQQYTRVQLPAGEQTAEDDGAANERLIRELDRETPHAIDEDFTFKRPHGYQLLGQAATGVTTWKRLLVLVCRHLQRKDPGVFVALPRSPRFLSRRGNRTFTATPDELRMPLEVAAGVHAETNLSANGVRDVIRDLLAEFAIPEAELKIYLRQDRNAPEA